jgi:O-methyltransferase
VSETLKTPAIEKICLLHLDLDFYSSTTKALELLYPKIITGGIILVNDYNVNNLNCKEAVLEFREKNNIANPIVELGKHLAYWIK